VLKIGSDAGVLVGGNGGIFTTSAVRIAARPPIGFVAIVRGE
jgi:hypothetical protein